MKIETSAVSIVEFPSNTGRFTLVEEIHGAQRRWIRRDHSKRTGQLHVLHVRTDEGIEGVCTAGDARYTTMRRQALEQLRSLAVSEDPLDRDYLNRQLTTGNRKLTTHRQRKESR